MARLALALSAAACGGLTSVDATTRDDEEFVPSLVDTAREELVQIVVPTYDGSNQPMHPDVLQFPREWHGAHTWMAITPYPSNDERRENPSVYEVSASPTVRVPSGAANPVVAPRHSGYNSDPDLTFDFRTHAMVLFYRVVRHGANTIMARATVDGRHWGVPHRAFSVASHGAVSPAIVGPREHRAAQMWYVDAGPAGCGARATRVLVRHAMDARPLVSARWSNPIQTDLAQHGYVVWHIDVRWVPAHAQYWAVYAAYPDDGQGCGGDDLFFAQSADGVHWKTFPSPIYRREDREWTRSALYRSTFQYDAPSDEIRLWVSGRDASGVWSTGYARLGLRHLLERIADPPPTTALATRSREVWRAAP